MQWSCAVVYAGVVPEQKQVPWASHVQQAQAMLLPARTQLAVQCASSVSNPAALGNPSGSTLGSRGRVTGQQLQQGSLSGAAAWDVQQPTGIMGLPLPPPLPPAREGQATAIFLPSKQAGRRGEAGSWGLDARGQPNNGHQHPSLLNRLLSESSEHTAPSLSVAPEALKGSRGGTAAAPGGGPEADLASWEQVHVLLSSIKLPAANSPSWNKSGSHGLQVGC